MVKQQLEKISQRKKKYIFVDTDEMIVEQQRRSINEIFATDGEQMFRDMETALLRQLIAEKKEHMVISTGGGMPLRVENRQLLTSLGKVVYLKASPKTIYDRIKGDMTRPLLQCENPMKRIEEMIAAREPLYDQAAMIVVDVNVLKQLEVTLKIIEKCE